MKTLSLRQLRHYWPLFLLLLPTFALIFTFRYYPAYSAVYHAFYRWNGDEVAELAKSVQVPWLGWEVPLGNFKQALSDDMLAQAFGTVMILIAANFVKMTPAIITAVVIHRLYSQRARYLYRVMFVVPMIIPAMVWLLIWKYFYNPTFGVLNSLLNGTYLMEVLNWLDLNMPRLAAFLDPVNVEIINPVFGSVWGLILAGVLCLALMKGLQGIFDGWMWWFGILAGGFFIWGAGRWVTFLFVMALALVVGNSFNLSARGKQLMGRVRKHLAGAGFGLLGAVAVASLGSSHALGHWALWPMSAGLTTVLRWAGWGIAGLGGSVFFLTLLTGAAAGTVWQTSGQTRQSLKRSGLLLIALAVVLIVTTLTWTRTTEVFQDGRPAWLGHPKLIVPALIFWGFPWVGVVSVLLYLSGLGNIDESVYEAAEIDGCGWIRKFWNVELPLIMTQVRLNLILMIIHTLRGWGLVFILLGSDGGPGNAGMLPGLYMFHKAFVNMRAGYACAIGLLLFFLVVYLTIINNKYVRVEK